MLAVGDCPDFCVSKNGTVPFARRYPSNHKMKNPRYFLALFLSACGSASLSAGDAAPAASRPDATWKDIGGVKIPVPPHEHPRLYLRAGHAAQLPARLEDPVLQPAVKKLQSMARQVPQFNVEWNALQYLIHHDRTEGRATVRKTLELLQDAKKPDRLDACRVTGRMMVTGAIVYDWLYDLLTPEEKKTFVRELIRLAKTQECGYPPTRQGSITGHASEAMILRDMMSAGIAIYDEYPEMYDLAAGRFFQKHLPARNWFYPGHAHHQGAAYGPYRYSWDAAALWIFDRLGAGNVFHPDQRLVPYYWIYATRPDGQRLRSGDTGATAPRGEPWHEYSGTLLTACYYSDGYLLAQHERQNREHIDDALVEILWRDTTLQPRPLSELPGSYYASPPLGWMIARTGWDENAVLAEMKVNVYNFCNHQHLDAGAFQLYYRGALAVDSGAYGGSSGNYGSEHCCNYYWRTIAHNALLIYDPGETFRDRWRNDGGQRLPNGRREPPDLDALLAPENGYRTGEVLAAGFGPDARKPAYTLLQGDLTAAYSKKARQVRRTFVFLNLGEAQTPAALIVFDRVAAANPDHRKFWLLHTQEEPRIGDASATIDCTENGQQGRLILDALLPKADNLKIEKVGGPGKEFWCFGENFANDPVTETQRKSSREPGRWRLELMPRQPSAVDWFLNVMQATDRKAEERLKVERMDAGTRVGCQIQGPNAFWCVLFHKSAEPSNEKVQFTTNGEGRGRYLLTDVAPGDWMAQRAGSKDVQRLRADNDTKSLWFEGPPGTWTIGPAAK
jgi:hypothetical protein